VEEDDAESMPRVPRDDVAEEQARKRTYDRRDPLLRDRIQQCVRRLSENIRSVILGIIRDRGSSPDKALAAALGISDDRFRKRKERGRKSVERCLETHGINLREYLR
jgi:DNA-directed RNA polymerase specialized sigma24 family protein